MPELPESKLYPWPTEMFTEPEDAPFTGCFLPREIFVMIEFGVLSPEGLNKWVHSKECHSWPQTMPPWEGEPTL